MLAITGTISGNSRGKLNQELDFNSPQERRWFRKLCTFYKIYKSKCLRYLHNLLPLQTSSCITRSSINIPCFYFKHNFFQFFPLWQLLNGTIWIYLHAIQKVWALFKKSILQFIRLSPSSTYNCFNKKEINHITRLPDYVLD